MKFLFNFLVIIISLYPGFANASVGAKWSYDDEAGPSHWAKMFFTCKGSRQSPINIETEAVKPQYWRPFIFKNYDATPSRMRIKNNGHSAQVEIDAPNAPRVMDGGLKGEYIFAQFHFHWGSNSGQGSEHTINSKKYPLEMHLVHYKASYGSLKAAVKHPDGLAVLGILFELSQTDNAAYAPLIKSLKDIEKPNRISEVEAIYPLSAYLPVDRDAFYRYDGSLTTPTCNEIVIWTVFEKSVPISQSQIAVFRSLLNANETPMVDNFREPQQLRSRKVYKNMVGGAETTSIKNIGIILSLVTTMSILFPRL